MVLPSVTGILADAGLIDRTFFTEEGRTRGKYVHTATGMIDRGTLDWEVLDDTLRPYCEAYAKFCRDTNPEIMLTEVPMHHPAHLYAGTPDRIVKMNGTRILLDLKTGAPAPATALQLAAYKEMIRANGGGFCSKSCALYLRADGTYRLHEYPNHERNLNIFLSALAVVRWKKEVA
jgi:hypothetical protein